MVTRNNYYTEVRFLISGTKEMKLHLNVELNGTDKNPWHQIGLTQNPFP